MKVNLRQSLLLRDPKDISLLQDVAPEEANTIALDTDFS